MGPPYADKGGRTIVRHPGGATYWTHDALDRTIKDERIWATEWPSTVTTAAT